MVVKMRTAVALGLAFVAVACASAPVAPPPMPVGPTFAEKMAWMLRLEDQRVLRDPAPPPAEPVAAPTPPRRGEKAPVVIPPPPPPPPPDLVRLLSDTEARVRRRAALAVGHVGLTEGVVPLVALLRDPDPEVRQVAAFSLGLIGDRSARDPLVAALGDESPLVQGSAAEALGLLGDPAAAEAIGRLASQVVQSGILAEIPGDTADSARDTPAAAFRLALFALVRLKAYDQLAAAVLDQSAQPRVRWWPVAYALQRLEDKRALPALVTLTREAHPYTRAFAAKGLGALKDAAVVPTLVGLVPSNERAVTIEAVRALGRIGDPSAAPLLQRLVTAKDAEPHVRLEALTALGGVHDAGVPGLMDTLLDAMTDPVPAIRAAALRSMATVDSQEFFAVLSSLDADADWSVRAALASVLGTLTPQLALPRLSTMLADQDQRVVPAVIDALVKLRPPNLAEILLARLKADDPVVRATAAAGLGEMKTANAEPALASAYQVAQQDAMYTTRAAVLDALAKYGLAAARPVLTQALTDKDWAVRVKAALLLKQLDPASAADVDRQIRPAPTRATPEQYQSSRLGAPPVSTQAFIDTDRGTIQIELAMLDAPLTVDNFVTLARRRYFDGLVIHRVVSNFVIQDGDPRGDGEGGPGFTIRDELNQRPYLRGAVGMALDPWPDTGGSQFFITHSPQPHLDAKYTLFGRVISGMEVVDQIQPGDVILRVRIWDGETNPN